MKNIIKKRKECLLSQAKQFFNDEILTVLQKDSSKEIMICQPTIKNFENIFLEYCKNKGLTYRKGYSIRYGNLNSYYISITI